jgi:hypothetical protein
LAGDHQTPGNDQSPGDGDAAASIDDALIDQRVNGLIDSGLERYGAGDLDGAVTEWEHALALSPDNPRAREYVDYVRENYELLQQRLEVVRQMEGSVELDVPFGLEFVDDDGDAYDMVEVSTETDLSDASSAEAQRAPTQRYVESVDEGWFLDDEEADDSADSLPPPPEAIDPALAAVPEPPADLFDVDGFPAGDTVGADGQLIGGGPELGFDLGDVDEGIDLDDPYDNLEFGDESEKTTEVTGRQMGFVRAASQNEPVSDDELTVPGGVEGETYPTDGLGLSDDALRAMTKRGMPRLDRESSPDETTAERSGIASRIRLDGLDELTAALGRDDRVLEDSGEAPALGNIEFRGEESGEEELTTERPAGWAGGRPAQPLDYSDADDEMEKTRDRSVIVDQGLLGGDEESSDDIEEATMEHQAVRASAVDEFDREAETQDQRRAPLEEFAKQLELPEEQPGGPFGDIVVQLLIDVDSGAPEDESNSERVRRRITGLLARADTEWNSNNHLTAVAAVDAALDEDPDTAVAQKLIHRNKDRLFEIYSSYLGDLDQCPVLALPMHELAQQNIDNRAAFLLSRIDGTLSFDDVLDVSGMTRLEAFRVIARMLIQGILEVR